MTVQITINGRLLQAQEGMTVLETARMHGIEIPTLCNHPKLKAVGSCRLCLVEVEPRANLATACTLQVQEGQPSKPKRPGWPRCERQFWNCFSKIMPMRAMQREIARPLSLNAG